MKRLLIALFMLALVSPAVASDCWNNVAGTQTNCAEVPNFLNGSNQTVPVSSTNPLPVSAAAGGGTSSTFGAVFPGAGTAAGAEFLTTPPTLTNGQMVPFFTDVNGNLKINIVSPATVPISATSLPLPANAAVETGGNLSALVAVFGAINDGSYTGSGNSTGTQIWRGIYNSINAPPTPCSTSNCNNSNPFGSIYNISGTVSLPTNAATATNQPTNAAQGAAIAGATGNLAQIQTLTADPTYTTATINPVRGNAFGYLDVANGVLSNQQTPVVTSNGTYAAGKVIGTLLTFSNTITSQEITEVEVTSQSAIMAGLTAYVFWQNPSGTTWTDNTAPAIVTADKVRIAMAVPLNNPSNDLGTHTVWTSTPLRLIIQSSTFFVLLVNNGPSFTLTSATTSDIVVRVMVKM